jgi:hypothetical protein
VAGRRRPPAHAGVGPMAQRCGISITCRSRDRSPAPPNAHLAGLLRLHNVLVPLPALEFLLVLNGPAEFGQALRDVGLLGQEGLAALLGLLELISLPCELYPGCLQMVGIGPAKLLPGLLGLVEPIRCHSQLAAGLVPAPGSKAPCFELHCGPLVAELRLMEVAGGLSDRAVRPTASAGPQVGGVPLDRPQLATDLVKVGRAVRRNRAS